VTAEREAEAPPRRQGRQAGYPGKLEFGAADQRLRRALSRLARDPDPDARLQGARLAAEAIEVLEALALRADEASTAAKRAKAGAERLGGKPGRARGAAPAPRWWWHLSDLDCLRRPDGSVLVPAEVAGSLLQVAVLGLRELVRRDGGAVAPELQRLLYALHDAAEAADAPEVEPAASVASGSASGSYATVAQAAFSLGCSQGWVRSLARRGLLLASRAGRAWLIDRASLDAYRHGRTAA
jgi:excisionase family DNA binding protein